MKKRMLTVAGVVAAFLLCGMLTGFTMDFTDYVRDSAFGVRTRGPVPFVHDEHNEKAGIDDCTACHHVYEDGEKLEFETSEDMECSECHMAGGKTRMDLITAYHQNCRGCHEEAGKGPVTCAGCHEKEVR